MMLILRNSSTISGYNLDFVNEVEITSSWENLTDTARFIIPKKLIFKRGGQIVDDIVRGDNPIFNIGDPVTLSAWYENVNNIIPAQRFQGYITEVKPKYPIEMMFSDEMYLLKQIKVGKYSKKNLTLSALLDDILPGEFERITDDREIGYVRIKDPNTTVAMVLEHLKKTQGIISYFRNGTLISGFAYITENPGGAPNTWVFDAAKNIIDPDGLEYVKEDEYKIKLTVVSIYPDNTKKETTAGDDGGDSRTIYVYDVPESQLQSIADQELLKFKYEGFRGSFTTFIDPCIKHGDAVTIIDERITDRNDTYLVKSVTTTYGMGGGRQIVELDRKISE